MIFTFIFYLRKHFQGIGGPHSASPLLRTRIQHSHATSFQRSPVIKHEQEFLTKFLSPH